MQRQKSILSFFKKPSPENRNSGAGGAPQFSVKQQNVSASIHPTAADTVVEIRGTDTPPEKVPRQIFPASFAENEGGKGSSLFSSIMHKFVKADDREKASERYHTVIFNELGFLDWFHLRCLFFSYIVFLFFLFYSVLLSLVDLKK